MSQLQGHSQRLLFLGGSRTKLRIAPAVHAASPVRSELVRGQRKDEQDHALIFLQGPSVFEIGRNSSFFRLLDDGHLLGRKTEVELGRRQTQWCFEWAQEQTVSFEVCTEKLIQSLGVSNN